MGVNERKDRRGKEKVYVDKQWPDGKRFQRVVPNRTIGKKLLSRIDESIAMETWREFRQQLRRITDDPVTVSDLATEYLEYCSIKNRRPEFKRLSMKPIEAILGNVPIKELSRAHVHDFRDKRSKQVGPASVNRNVSVLKNMFTFALEKGYIDIHPLIRFSMLPEPKRALRVMTLEEERHLIECVDRYDLGVAAMTAVNGELGLRKSEGIGLEWKHLDFTNRMASLEYTKGGEVRYVPLTDFAVEWLGKLTRVVGESHVFLQRNWKHWKDPRGPFNKGREDAGLDWVGFHDLRHFRATQWVRHGVAIPKVQILLGHADIQTTMRYIHFAPDDSVLSVKEVEQIEKAEIEAKRMSSVETVK